MSLPATRVTLFKFSRFALLTGREDQTEFALVPNSEQVVLRGNLTLVLYISTAWRSKTSTAGIDARLAWQLRTGQHGKHFLKQNYLSWTWMREHTDRIGTSHGL